MLPRHWVGIAVVALLVVIGVDYAKRSNATAAAWL